MAIRGLMILMIKLYDYMLTKYNCKGIINYKGNCCFCDVIVNRDLSEINHD